MLAREATNGPLRRAAGDAELLHGFRDRRIVLVWIPTEGIPEVGHVHSDALIPSVRERIKGIRRSGPHRELQGLQDGAWPLALGYRDRSAVSDVVVVLVVVVMSQVPERPPNSLDVAQDPLGNREPAPARHHK